MLLSGWVLGLEGWLRSHGGNGLRGGIRGFWGAVAIIGVVLLVGPVINPPLTLDDITSSASTATDTWIAREFAADYTVGVADDGTLSTAVEERITAFFGDDVDESGIQRVIATEYQGHDLDPSAISATLNGDPIEVAVDAAATRITLDLDTGERLRGDHDFVIRYTLDHLAYDTEDRATGAPVQVLEWDVFGVEWPHGVAGLDITVDLPDALNEQLVRQPRGSLAWTLIGGGVWLNVEDDSPAGRAVYAFENDQNIPPNASAVFTVALEPGTIVMPPPSPVFLVQSFGPLAPLAFLLATLLLAMAARAVAWSDARGRPWFVAQYEPPRGVSPSLAAHILRSPRALELARELDAVPDAARRDGGSIAPLLLLRVGQAARRTGRFGNLPRAWRLYVTGPESAQQFRDGLRRVPEGFVRDAFIAAPLALTLVQWGLVRQLSYQAPLAIVWWPAAFVIVSTVIAVAVLALALTARPLTPEGALVKQHLRGIEAYAERTSMLERGTLGEAALPYAVLLAPARRAGAAIAGRVEVELGSRIPRRSWHTADYLTAPRLAIRALALLLVAGAIAVTSLVDNPLDENVDYVAYSSDVAGSLDTSVVGFTASAELSRGDDGRAVITATENLDVVMADGGSLPPQLVRQWPATADGQDLGVGIHRVLLDGEPIDYVTEKQGDTLVMRTTMTQPVLGEHEVLIEYTIGSAAVASAGAPGGEVVDRVRWSALLEGWEWDYRNDDGLLEPMRVELTVSDELAAEATVAGWLTQDTTPEEARDWPDAVVPFGAIADDYDAEAMTEGEETVGGVTTHTLDIGQTEFGSYPSSVTRDDVGVMLDFAAGTFSGPDEGALRSTQLQAGWPPVAIVVFSTVSAGLGIVAVLAARRARTVILRHGPLRDLLRWLAPGAALAGVILFVWITVDIDADHPAVAMTGVPTLASLAGAAVALWFGWRGSGTRAARVMPARTTREARSGRARKKRSGSNKR